MCRASSETALKPRSQNHVWRRGRPLDANGALREEALFAAAPRRALRRLLCCKSAVTASCLDDELPYAPGCSAVIGSPRVVVPLERGT